MYDLNFKIERVDNLATSDIRVWIALSGGGDDEYRYGLLNREEVISLAAKLYATSHELLESIDQTDDYDGNIL